MPRPWRFLTAQPQRWPLLTEYVFPRHNAPEVALFGRGRASRYRLMQEVMSPRHTSNWKTAPYHPQTDGQTERLNNSIADMLSMYVDVERQCLGRDTALSGFRLQDGGTRDNRLQPFSYRSQTRRNDDARHRVTTPPPRRR